MKRRLFTILSALSLLLCVAVCVMWVRSYWVADTLSFRYREGTPTRWFFVTSGRGRAGIASYWFNYPWQPTPEWAHGRVGWRTAPVKPAYAEDSHKVVWERLGVRLYRYADRRNHAAWSLSLSYLYIPLLPLPLLALLYLFPTRRRRSGLCPSCGYDLRATPGRCPECGLVPTAPLPPPPPS